jgi:hypothetical protein
MSELDYPSNSLNQQNLIIPSDNKRRATRHYQIGMESFIKFSRLFVPCETTAIIQDISSKGGTVKCTKKFRNNEKICLKLSINDAISFAIYAVVVHRKSDRIYGVKFQKYHGALADYLFQTQLNLIFSSSSIRL